MATVKKKARGRPAAQKPAEKPEIHPDLTEEQIDQVAQAAVDTPEIGQEIEKAAEEAVESMDLAKIEQMIADAVEKMVPNVVEAAIPRLVAAVTAESPQTVPDAPVSDDAEDLDVLALTDPIAAQLASQSPGGRTVEAAPLQTNPLTAEQIDKMTPEEIDAYNRNELLKTQARKAQQMKNRSELERMHPSERIRYLTGKRDPSIIREADNLLGEKMVKVQTKRRIGLGEQGTSDLDEVIMVPLSGARRLQDEGAVRVLI